MPIEIGLLKPNLPWTKKLLDSARRAPVTSWGTRGRPQTRRTPYLRTGADGGLTFGRPFVS